MRVSHVKSASPGIMFSLLLTQTQCFSLSLLLSFSGPPADHWALVSGLPTYVAENGFVSLS